LSTYGTILDSFFHGIDWIDIVLGRYYFLAPKRNCVQLHYVARPWMILGQLSKRLWIFIPSHTIIYAWKNCLRIQMIVNLYFLLGFESSYSCKILEIKNVIDFAIIVIFSSPFPYWVTIQLWGYLSPCVITYWNLHHILFVWSIFFLCWFILFFNAKLSDLCCNAWESHYGFLALELWHLNMLLVLFLSSASPKEWPHNNFGECYGGNLRL